MASTNLKQGLDLDLRSCAVLLEVVRDRLDERRRAGGVEERVVLCCGEVEASFHVTH